MKNVTLKACIVRAYVLTDAQVYWLSWLESERFDITHRETREQTLYDLVVAKSGPKLKKVEFRGNQTAKLPYYLQRSFR